jgi:transcriptional regulator with XRE-family HTH domain
LQKCNGHDILSSARTGFSIKGGITLARELTPSERIDQLRDEKGWMKAELAKRIGVHPSQIGRIISGDTASISSDILIGLAKEFGVSADYILGLTPVRAPKNSDISELGLSEVAVRKLLDGSINTDILNRLMEHKDFPFLLKLIQIYF